MTAAWLDPARVLLARHACIVRLRVEHTRGSSPRDAGAVMLVAPDRTWGSIGGGRLEWESLADARRLLADPDAPPRREREFILGPDLNQCCGGRVSVSIERLTAKDLACSATSRPEDRLVLQLHGAGHVAQAVVALLHDLPTFELDWRDVRTDVGAWRGDLPGYRVTADPARAAADAPAGALVLVMTHDHALDYAICRAVLERDDAMWLGLIASASKAARFRSRFTRGGLAAQSARLLQAPVGIPGITGKAPAVIAVSIVAQLLLLASQTHGMRERRTDAQSCGACAGCAPVPA